MSHEDDLARFAARRMAAAEKNTAENASVTLGAKITRDMVVNGPPKPIPHPLTSGDRHPTVEEQATANAADEERREDMGAAVDPPIVEPEKKKRGRPKTPKTPTH